MLHAVSRLLALDCEIVGSVADGGALLETAQRLQPDVVVLDVNLPNVRSLEACRDITRMNPKIKVIMFTAVSDSGGQRGVPRGRASSDCVSSQAETLLLLAQQHQQPRTGTAT